MSEIEFIQPQEVTEEFQTTDAAAEQRLADATYEAGARVEQSGSYAQSEQVETTYTTVVESIVDVADQEAVQKESLAASIDPVSSKRLPKTDSAGSL